VQTSSGILRWLGLIPAVVVGTIVTWFIASILSSIGWAQVGFDPDGFLVKAFRVWFTHIAAGVAFVYFGTEAAPGHQTTVGLVLAGLGLLIAGFLAFPAFMVKDYWAIAGAVSVVMGIGGALQAVFVKHGRSQS
jgi:FtsH-binding integral membrane protein